VVLVAVSALAEGADRLVANAVLESTQGRLEVVLPLPKEWYLKDFETEESRKAFHDLCERASLIVYAGGLPDSDEEDFDRDQQYRLAGESVVDRCDVLLALWDGKTDGGTGGTRATMQYAFNHSVPVIWVPTEEEGLFEDLGRGALAETFVNLKFDGRRESRTVRADEARRAFDILDHYNQVP
jgi:hypothetical protein